jgi:hypothetical protein
MTSRMLRVRLSRVRLRVMDCSRTVQFGETGEFLVAARGDATTPNASDDMYGTCPVDVSGTYSAAPPPLLANYDAGACACVRAWCARK